MSKIDGARQFVMRLASCWEWVLSDNGSDEERRIHGGRAINATIKSIRIAAGSVFGCRIQMMGWVRFRSTGFSYFLHWPIDLWKDFRRVRMDFITLGWMIRGVCWSALIGNEMP